MRKKIKTSDLKVGMYVNLSGNWFKHDFMKNKFIISSQSQIDKIVQSGIKEVTTDPDKGVQTIKDVDCVNHEATSPSSPPKVFEKESYEAPKEWQPENLVSSEFIDTIRSKTTSPQKKAKYIYTSSIEIMEKVLKSPVAKNIRETKEGIAAIVDVILAEDETARQLLKITSHDFYTYTHSVNVGVLSTLLCKVLFKHSDGHDMHELGAGFFLHDIGKTQVDPAIINKPGKLTDVEMKKMRTHPYQGYKILKMTGQLSEECRHIVMQHHERKDGTGYPKKIKDEDIHVYGKIGCIADVYDALTAERSYKPALKPFEALSLMKESMIDHFNQDIFSKFVMILHDV